MRLVAPLVSIARWLALWSTQESISYIVPGTLATAHIESRLEAVDSGETLDSGWTGNTVRLSAGDAIPRIRGGTGTTAVPSPGGWLIQALHSRKTRVGSAVVYVYKYNSVKMQ